MILQGAVDKIVEKEELESPEFLADARNVSLIKQRLGTEEGIQYYAKYLGEKQESAANQEQSRWSIDIVVTYVMLSVLVSMAAVYICQSIWKRLNMRD